MRFRHKDASGELYTLVSIVNEPEIQYGKLVYVTYVYCKNYTTQAAAKFPVEELFRYE